MPRRFRRSWCGSNQKPCLFFKDSCRFARSVVQSGGPKVSLVRSGLLSWGSSKIAPPPVQMPCVLSRVGQGPPFGSELPNSVLLPPLSFFPTSAVYSARHPAGLLHPASGHGVRNVSASRRPPAPEGLGVLCSASPVALHPSKHSPPQQVGVRHRAPIPSRRCHRSATSSPCVLPRPASAPLAGLSTSGLCSAEESVAPRRRCHRRSARCSLGLRPTRVLDAGIPRRASEESRVARPGRSEDRSGACHGIRRRSRVARRLLASASGDWARCDPSAPKGSGVAGSRCRSEELQPDATPAAVRPLRRPEGRWGGRPWLRAPEGARLRGLGSALAHSEECVRSGPRVAAHPSRRGDGRASACRLDRPFGGGGAGAGRSVFPEGLAGRALAWSFGLGAPKSPSAAGSRRGVRPILGIVLHLSAARIGLVELAEPSAEAGGLSRSCPVLARRRSAGPSSPKRRRVRGPGWRVRRGASRGWCRSTRTPGRSPWLPCPAGTRRSVGARP